MNVTLKDIAEMVGVSVSTASRILNQGSAPATETQKKVCAAARELGYKDRKRDTLEEARKLSCSLVCVFVSEYESLLSPFFTDLHNGILAEIRRLSPFLLATLDTVSAGGGNFPPGWDGKKYDGAIILGRTDRATIQRIREAVPYCVYAGLNTIPGIDNAVSDVDKGIGDIVRHLASSGRRRLGFIGPVLPSSESVNEYRHEAFRHALEEMGIPYDPALVQPCHLDAKDGYEAAKKMLAGGGKPDAIVCGNDNTAIGVMKALFSEGYRIPDDIALTGYDDIPDAAYLTPSLTTVHVPRGDLGRYGIDILLDAMGSGRQYPIRVELPHALIVRESTEKKEKNT